MSHFAKVENDVVIKTVLGPNGEIVETVKADNIVTQVIVAEQDFIDTGVMGDPSLWVQTSYNTQEGVHLLGGTPFRKNFAAVGFTYDRERDAFYGPKPFPSWTLIEESCQWQSPVPYPTDDKKYRWNESTLSWDLAERGV